VRAAYDGVIDVTAAFAAVPTGDRLEGVTR